MAGMATQESGFPIKNLGNDGLKNVENSSSMEILVRSNKWQMGQL